MFSDYYFYCRKAVSGRLWKKESRNQDVHSSDQEEPDAEALEEGESVHNISAEEEPEDMT